MAFGYFAGDREAPLKELRRLTEYCSRQQILLLIRCDAKAHNIVWGSSKTIDRGEQLIKFILESNLSIFDYGNSPTFKTMVRQKVLYCILKFVIIQQCFSLFPLLPFSATRRPFSLQRFRWSQGDGGGFVER